MYWWNIYHLHLNIGLFVPLICYKYFDVTAILVSKGYLRKIAATNKITANAIVYWKHGCNQRLAQVGHDGHDGVSNHQPHHCLHNRFFRCRSKRTSKLRISELCAGNSPVTGEFPAQMTSNAKDVSIWWRLPDIQFCDNCVYVKVEWRRCFVNGYLGVVWNTR